MKISFKLAKYAFVALAVVAIASCSNNASNTKATNGKDKVAEDATALSIRYIDEDSLLLKYNLALDLNESMLRRSNEYDKAATQRQNQIQKFGSEVQQKYQTNGYLSEQSFRSDEQKLNKMQQDAQNYLGRLQRDIQNEMMQNQIQLTDSINNFLKEFCEEKGYDMVLRKSASFYMDEKNDVTNDVVEGLNKRYNKVSND